MKIGGFFGILPFAFRRLAINNKLFTIAHFTIHLRQPTKKIFLNFGI